MTHNTAQTAGGMPFNYDNFQKLYKEVVELRKLSLSLTDQLEKAKTKKE